MADYPTAPNTASLVANSVGAAEINKSSVRLLGFGGHNGPGACTATGTKVGDEVVSCLDTSGAPFVDRHTEFEATITINNQIQQTGLLDRSTSAFVLLVIAKGG